MSLEKSVSDTFRNFKDSKKISEVILDSKKIPERINIYAPGWMMTISENMGGFLIKIEIYRNNMSYLEG